MIVSIFKKNLFFNSLLLLPFAMIMRLYSLVNASLLKPVEEGGILYQLLIKILPDSPVFYSFLSIFVVFIEAVLINRLVIKNRFSRDITLLPGMFFIILVSLSPKMHILSPILSGLLFVILSFADLFKTYKKYQSERYLFNAGFYLGIAALFYFNYIILIIPLFLGFLSIKAFKWIEVFQLISGLLLVVYFYAFGLYWYGEPLIFPKISFNLHIFYPQNLFDYLIIGFYLFFIINTIFTYRKFVIKKSIQSQKKINIIFSVLIFSIATVFLINPDDFYNYLYLMAFALSYFTAAIFLRIKNNLLVEIVTVILIFVILIYHFQFFYK